MVATSGDWAWLFINRCGILRNTESASPTASVKLAVPFPSVREQTFAGVVDVQLEPRRRPP